MAKVIMSGNEAIARGVWEAGCKVAAAYPGTPSTEILENVGAFYKKDIYCEWSCNEKVAFEIAAGASIGGVRSFCAFKHVGMNVAADPIFTMGYTGVTGGLVFVSADDPGQHSSQNEQDNRLYAPHAKIGMMEPSDSQECKDFVKASYELSEKFDIPMMVRMTTRVCHAKGLVELEDRQEFETVKYVRNPQKYAMLPANARRRHVIREDLLKMMEEYSNDCPFNRVEKNGGKVGIITSGISYQHAKEVFGDTADYLKIGLTYPLPRKLMAEFGKNYETLYVIEENDPYLEDVVRSLGLKCIGKDRIPICGELNAAIIRQALIGGEKPELYKTDLNIPGRAPALCAGCPHRGFFYALSTRLKKIVPVGDIGCYALGINPPLNGFDYSICMGSGASSIIGLAKGLEAQGDPRKALGIVGDSTFFHTGLVGLVNMVASQSNAILVVVDNSITAMTGHQDNPGTAKNLMGEPTPIVDLVKLIKATDIGDDRVEVVHALDLKAIEAALDKAIATPGPFVIVTKEPCVMIKEIAKARGSRHCTIDPEKCKKCKACMRLTCPAIAFIDGKVQIDVSQCTGCGLCMQMCKFGAIEKVEAK